MKTVIKKILANNFYVLSIGTIFSQGLTLLIFLIIVKFNIYTPKEIGLLNIVINSMGILSVLFSLKYESAIAQSISDEDASQVLLMCIVWSILFFIFFQFFFIIIPEAIINDLGFSDLRFYVYLIPAHAFLFTTNQFFILRLNRNGKYKLNVLSKIITAILFVLILWLATIFLKNTLTIVIAQFISLLCVTLFLCYKNKDVFLVKFNAAIFKSKSKQHIDLPEFFLGTSLLDKLSVNLPLLFVNRNFDATAAGYFGFSERILGSPSGIITSSISQILYQDVCKNINNKREYYTIFKRTLKKLFYMGALPFMLIIISGDYIAKYFLNAEWQGVGIYLQCIAAVQFIRFIVSPLSVILIANKETKSLALWQITYFISIITILAISYLNKSIFLFLQLYVSAEIILYSIYLYLIYKSAKNSVL